MKLSSLHTTHSTHHILCERLQRSYECVDVVGRVVQRECGSHGALVPEMAQDRLCAVVPGADGNAVSVEPLANFFVGVSVELEGQRGCLVERGSYKVETLDSLQFLEAVLQQFMFPPEYAGHSDFGEVLERFAKTNGVGDASGTRFELVRDSVVDGAFKCHVGNHVATAVIRAGGFEQFLLAVNDADACRGEHLVSREHEEVCVEGGNVYRNV